MFRISCTVVVEIVVVEGKHFRGGKEASARSRCSHKDAAPGYASATKECRCLLGSPSIVNRSFEHSFAGEEGHASSQPAGNCSR